MAPMRWSCVMFAFQFLLAQAAQTQQPPDYNCSATPSLSQQSSVPEKDPCSNTGYSELGSCADFIAGNVTTPSAECCASAHNIWTSFPACFCEVTFFSEFPGAGSARARARPKLCNITDDLCSQCPTALLPFRIQSDDTGGHKRKINTAFVVTISVIVTLVILGCVWLLYFCKKKAPGKPKQSPSKNYVPHFSNV